VGKIARNLAMWADKGKRYPALESRKPGSAEPKGWISCTFKRTAAAGGRR
jgi:hypothetical protein